MSNARYSSIAALLLFVSSTPQTRLQEHRLQRGDVSLVYETEGKGDPVILLAGGPGVTPYSVEHPFHEVAKDHLAVLIHQRGTGKTALDRYDQRHVSIPLFVEDIDKVREELHAEKITLIGHSWGGMLSMAYAAAHPDRVSRLILMDSGGANLSFAQVFSDNITMRLLPEDLQDRDKANAERRTDPEMASYHYLQSILPGYFFKREAALEFRKELKPQDYNARIAPFLMGSYNVADSVSAYHGPVAIIQGRQDPIDASTVLLNKNFLPQAKVHWIERAGHIPWLEREEAFDRTLQEALSES